MDQWEEQRRRDEEDRRRRDADDQRRRDDEERRRRDADDQRRRDDEERRRRDADDQRRRDDESRRDTEKHYDDKAFYDRKAADEKLQRNIEANRYFNNKEKAEQHAYEKKLTQSEAEHREAARQDEERLARAADERRRLDKEIMSVGSGGLIGLVLIGPKLVVLLFSRLPPTLQAWLMRLAIAVMVFAIALNWFVIPKLNKYCFFGIAPDTRFCEIQSFYSDKLPARTSSELTDIDRWTNLLKNQSADKVKFSLIDPKICQKIIGKGDPECARVVAISSAIENEFMLALGHGFFDLNKTGIRKPEPIPSEEIRAALEKSKLYYTTINDLDSIRSIDKSIAEIHKADIALKNRLIGKWSLIDCELNQPKACSKEVAHHNKEFCKAEIQKAETNCGRVNGFLLEYTARGVTRSMPNMQPVTTSFNYDDLSVTGGRLTNKNVKDKYYEFNGDNKLRLTWENTILTMKRSN